MCTAEWGVTSDLSVVLVKLGTSGMLSSRLRISYDSRTIGALLLRLLVLKICGLTYHSPLSGRVWQQFCEAKS